MKQKKLYVTTSIPYVNAHPHVGFALELVQADVIARHARLNGREVRFQTGTDENALKNVLAARQAGQPVRAFVDANVLRFRDLLSALAISADGFVRTSSPEHHRGAQAFWQCLRPEDVYRSTYAGLYCTGCEDFYAEKDLVDGGCPDHRRPLVRVEEENYFFRLSAYQTQIEELIASGWLEIVPQIRRNEVLAFVRRGLKDFSISRPIERADNWGVPVPGDPSQVIYVWVDALVNYLSGPGLGLDDGWRAWWNDGVEKVHVIGKNVWKFHAIYWPALLLSAGLPLPDRLVVHGFLTVEGQKIGKSAGNAVDPFEIIRTFGADPLRHYLLSAVSPFGDSDFTPKRFAEVYRNDLVDGLGNLLSRVLTLSEKAGLGGCEAASFLPTVSEALNRYTFDEACGRLWELLANVDRDIDVTQPWALLKQGDTTTAAGVLDRYLRVLATVADGIRPLLPDTAEKVFAALRTGRKPAALFPRVAETPHGDRRIV